MHAVIRTLTLPALTLLLPSCWSSDSVDSNKVSDDALYTDYTVDFDAVTNRTSVQAQFRVGGPTGTTVRLAKPSEISVNGQGLNLLDGDDAAFNVIGSYYKLERLPKRESYDFTFIDNNSQKRKDTAVLPEPVSVKSPSEADVRSISDDLTIEFDASNLRDNEYLELRLEGKELVKGKKQAKRLTATVRQRDDTVLKAEDLAAFDTSEPLRVYVRRVMTERTTNPHGQGIRITSSFTAKPTTLHLSK